MKHISLLSVIIAAAALVFGIAANAQDKKDWAKFYRYADANEQGGLNPENAKDGVHPNLETYKIMEEALLKAIK